MHGTEGDLLEAFLEDCKRNNLRVTPQRFAIFREVKGSKDHPTAEMMYRRVRRVFPNISFDTVNRTLLKFSDIGVVNIVEGLGVPRQFDPDTRTHHHLMCIKCRRIEGYFQEDTEEIAVPGKIRKGFTIIRRKVIYQGICKSCQACQGAVKTPGVPYRPTEPGWAGMWQGWRLTTEKGTRRCWRW